MFLFSNRTNCIVRTLVVTVLRSWALCCLALIIFALAADIACHVCPSLIQGLAAPVAQGISVAPKKAAGPERTVTGLAETVNPPNETVGE